jgi:2-polyprenyl-3-methyl-5-hydroxy-6-metoxy-1,4-benzoquinol methylase
MNQDSSLSPEHVAAQRDAFMERFLGHAAGAFNIFAIYLGDRLGLYRALAEAGPSTAGELAARTGTNARYIREWLEQQTLAGIVQVADETQAPEARRYSLPPGHVEPLIDCQSLNYLVPLAQLLVGAARPMPEILNAYRNGGGVPFAAYGADLREGQSAINYAAFTKQLAAEWLPAMPDVHARLAQVQPPARVADFGCGYGWSSIALAQAYPAIQVDGFDLDEASIERARANAQTNHVADRVHFHVRDAGDPALAGRYDLVTAFETIHDMSNPAGALATMHRLASQHGTVLVVDERVGDTFTAQGNDVEWMMYGWSILHCLPVGMADQPSAATGTVMRADTLRRYAVQAGYQSVEVLPVENFFFRMYRLNP